MGRPKGSTNKLKQNESNLDLDIEAVNNNGSIEGIGASESKFFVPRNYARSQVQPLWSIKPNNTATRKYTSDEIGKLLLNPYATYKDIQNASNYLLFTSSAYNNFIEYLSNSLTWDYVLECEDIDNVKQNTIENRYYESAKVIHKINVKTIFPAILKRALLNGETYFYNMSDKNNCIIVEIDSNICQLAQIDNNNIWRYYINLSLINPLTKYELPEEIQNAYSAWIDGGKKKDKVIIEGIEIPSYLYLVSDNGFAIFVHMKKTQHDYPYLAHMFEDLNDLESDKSYMNDYIKENNIKLIHMKVPTDQEGKPLMDEAITRVYHESAKEHLPRNVAPLTNPFDVESISLDKSQSAAINLVEHSTKVVMQDSGISENIFNSSSTLGLQYSTLADATKLYPLLYFFENFINLQIKQYKCKVRFLKINYYNQLEWHERFYADVLTGGSRSLFAVTSGMEPYDIINLAKTEKAIGMDDLLEPKMNASQMSTDDLNSENGRPKKKPKEATDSTNKVNEYD